MNCTKCLLHSTEIGFFFLFPFFLSPFLKFKGKQGCAPKPCTPGPFPSRAVGPGVAGLVPPPRPALRSRPRLHFVYWFAPARGRGVCWPRAAAPAPAAPPFFPRSPGPAAAPGPTVVPARGGAEPRLLHLISIISYF